MARDSESICETDYADGVAAERARVLSWLKLEAAETAKQGEYTAIFTAGILEGLATDLGGASDGS